MSIEPFIKCSDLNRSLHFYSKLLDFKVLQEPDSNPASFMSKYAFIEREGGFVHLSAHAGDGVAGNVIYVRVKGIEALYQKFVENGVETNREKGNSRVSMKLVNQTWGMKEFAVLDPDGNRVCFGEKIESKN